MKTAFLLQSLTLHFYPHLPKFISSKGDSIPYVMWTNLKVFVFLESTKEPLHHDQALNQYCIN